jgi:hypothetical protein
MSGNISKANSKIVKHLQNIQFGIDIKSQFIVSKIIDGFIKDIDEYYNARSEDEKRVLIDYKNNIQNIHFGINQNLNQYATSCFPYSNDAICKMLIEILP